MKCPQCKSERTSCKDSRPTKRLGADSIRRRRKCSDCGYKFTTWELDEIDMEHIHRKSTFAISQMKQLIGHLEMQE